MKKTDRRIYIPFAIFLIVSFPVLFLGREETLLAINGFHTHGLDLLFKQITWLAEGFLIVCCIITLLFVRVKWFFVFLIALLIHLFLININKHYFFVDVDRPLGYLTAIGKENLLHFVEGIRVNYKNSFPSGHTTGATFSLTFLAVVFNKRNFAWFFALLGFLVGISRVYLAQHFFIDIYFGFLFGAFSSFFAEYILSRMENKYPWMNKRLITTKLNKN